MEKEELLGEVEDILRTMPPKATIRHGTEENFAWLGRVTAFVEAWSPIRLVDDLNFAMGQFHGRDARIASEGLRKIITLLHRARHRQPVINQGPRSRTEPKKRLLRLPK